MESTRERILKSKIFTFVVGADQQNFSVHEAALSGLSKPLNVLLTGPYKEAQELRVEWPHVDEKTFIHFVQWAYTKDYVTEDPEIILDHSNIVYAAGSQPESICPPLGLPLYYSLHSLNSLNFLQCLDTALIPICCNQNCKRYQSFVDAIRGSATCSLCCEEYYTIKCSACSAALTGSSCHMCDLPQFLLPKKEPPTYYTSLGNTNSGSVCLEHCPWCNNAAIETMKPGQKRHKLVTEFLDTSGTAYRTSSVTRIPRKNTEGCEDYGLSDVLLCHAELYVLGDTYDMTELCQLSRYRLHAILKDLTIHPSCLDDIATMAKYVFENTRSDDKIREMITLYYACIVELASKHESLQSLIEECPDFAHGLIARMSERLN